MVVSWPRRSGELPGRSGLIPSKNPLCTLVIEESWLQPSATDEGLVAGPFCSPYKRQGCAGAYPGVCSRIGAVACPLPCAAHVILNEPVSWLDSISFGARILIARHPSKRGSALASPNVHSVVTDCRPASLNTSSYVGPVAPSLRVNV